MKTIQNRELQGNINIVGNIELQNEIFEAYHNKRLPHALIFSGNKGVGKSLVANKLIKLMYGNNHNTDLMIDENTHPDFLKIENKEDKEINTELVRKIGEFLSQTPILGKNKIVLLDGCDNLNVSSANALLKILEEPPKNSYIFLICTSPNRLPSTIRSRCRVARFRDLNEQECVSIVGKIDNFKELYSLVGGRPGEIINFVKLNALDYYKEILDNFIDFNESKMENFFASISSKNEDVWNMVNYIVLHIFSKLAKRSVGIVEKYEIVNGENIIIEKLTSCENKSKWIDLYERINSLFDDANRASLDKKHILLLIFNLVHIDA